MSNTLTMIAGWALGLLLGYCALALVGVACKVMYLAFMSGWGFL
jgi:hypothetical protein